MKTSDEIPKIPFSVDRVMVMLGDKYTLKILYLLYHYGPLEFYALNHAIYEMTPNLLTERLRYLERLGLISKQIRWRVMPQAEKIAYQLMDRGKSFALLAEALEVLGQHWGERWFRKRGYPGKPRLNPSL